jgi:hypothetical protein
VPVVPQRVEHAPPAVQSLGSSQPLSIVASQSAKPVSQLATAHVPAEQAAVAFGIAHVRPHPPQLVGSVAVSTHSPSHGVPVAHAPPSDPGGPASVRAPPSTAPSRPPGLPASSRAVGASSPVAHAAAATETHATRLQRAKVTGPA